MSWGQLARDVDAMRRENRTDMTVQRTRRSPALSTTATVPHTDVFAEALSRTGWATRDMAMLVPAVRNARNVLCQCATFPLGAWRGTAQVDPALWSGLQLTWLSTVTAAQLAMTVDDLLFYGTSYWRVTARYATSDAASAFRRVEDPASVTRLDDGYAVSTADGYQVVPAADMVVFDSGGFGGILRSGGSTIRTALELESRAWTTASQGMPAYYLNNDTGIPMDDEEAAAASAAVSERFRLAGVPVLNGLSPQKLTWSPAELQLVEARQHAALEIARLCNVDPDDIGAPSASSMTYSNSLEKRRDRVEVRQAPYMVAISDALSARVQRGITIRLDPQAFLRLGPAERMSMWQTAVASGVLTVDEVRYHEPLAAREMP